MRKIFVVFCVCLILILVGCKSTQDNSSSFNSEISHISSVINSVSETSSDSQNTISDEPETSSEFSGSQPVNSNVEEICKHIFEEKKVEATCTEGGYVDKICKKCGYTVRSETFSAYHDGIKYVCDRCGALNPDADKFWALNAWISMYGEPNGHGNMICYPGGDSPISISNYLDDKRLFIEYYNPDNGEIFNVFVQDYGYSSVSYFLGSTSGSFEVENSVFSSDNKIVFDEFYTPDDSPMDCDEFATILASKIDGYMLRVQNEILYPETGLKLKDLGFTNYE